MFLVRMGFPGAIVVKKLPAKAGGRREAVSIPGWGKTPRRKKWQPKGEKNKNKRKKKKKTKQKHKYQTYLRKC